MSPGKQPELKREMGLRDVTLFAVACIVGTRWIPAAAHVGPGAITLWLLAAVLFVVPLAIAVAALIVKYPGAGGLYIWTRGDYGPWHGFLAFWVYWMGLAVWFPTATMFYMSVGFFTLGPKYAPLADNRIALVTAALLAIWLALGSNLIGVKIGKWTENIGGAATWVLGVLFVGAAALVWSVRGSATPMHVLPHWNWGTVSFWATIAYGMSGLELAGMMGGEIRDPERTLPRAGWIASIFTTVFYAGVTAAMLILLEPSKISDRTGYAQAGAVASRILGMAWLTPVIAILVVASGIGQVGGMGTAMSRLPFAAGVDRLLPEAFSRVHPRWGTPHLSILALGTMASFLLLVFQIGDTMQAAYEELVSLMVIAGFLPYLYIFGSSWKAGNRISSIGGWGVTVMAILCAVIPSEQITNIWLYEGKLSAGTLAVIGSAWLVYRRAPFQRTC